MGKMTACCGGSCDTCTILLATAEKDEEKKYQMRVEIAQQIKEIYHQDCKPEDVTDCDGCRSPDERILAPSRDCQVRKCVMQKGVENCAHCDEYVCKNLEDFFTKEPTAKETLEAIRKDM